jgi:hypothetical protein
MRRVLAALSGAILVAACAAVGAAQERRPRPIRYEPFEVEVLVGGVPLAKYAAHGRLYVEATQGAEYEIRVRNPLPVRVAVALSVDGLNTIDARRSTARDASKWVIRPHGTITVGGWQVSQSRARRFYFTNERDSYAGKLGRPEDVGIITAVFFRERESYSEVVPRPRPLGTPRAERGEGGDGAKRRQAPPASAENSARADGAGQARGRVGTVAPAPEDDEYAATGIGRSVDYSVRWVQLDLEDHASAQVTIRYEYRPALVRLGILPRRHAEPDPLRRRERARGFEEPRYSPEPPRR